MSFNLSTGMAPAAQGQRNRSGVFRCSGITKVKDLASSYLVGLQVSDTCVIRVSAPLESKGPTPSTLYDLEFDRLNMVMGSQYILDPTLQESAREAPRRGLLHPVENSYRMYHQVRQHCLVRIAC